MIDTIMDFLYGICEWALGILPDSPIQKSLENFNVGAFGNVMGFINYFIPVKEMLLMLTTYLVAVGVWYVVRWVLRLAQYID